MRRSKGERAFYGFSNCNVYASNAATERAVVKEFKTFERVVETGNLSETLIATGLVEMDPREPEDHVRQRLVDLPVFHASPAIQTTFFSPDPRAQPMVAWDLTLVQETNKTILKITGQTIDAQPVKGLRYFCYYTATGSKPQALQIPARFQVGSAFPPHSNQVHFSPAFPSIPIVVLSVVPPAGHPLRISVFPTDVSRTGFTIVYTWDGTGVPAAAVNWIAAVP